MRKNGRKYSLVGQAHTFPGGTMEQVRQDIDKVQRLIGLLAMQVAEIKRELQEVQRGAVMDYEHLLDRIREADVAEVME